MLTDILTAKGRDVISAPLDVSVRSVVELMSLRKVGCVGLADGNGKIVGMLTDKSVVDGVAALGSAFLDAKARQHMISPIPTCDISNSVSRTMRQMTNDRTRHLFVMDGDKMAGIVSIGDVVKARMRDATLEALVLRDLAQARMLSS
jgi:CBS domain-containing protein